MLVCHRIGLPLDIGWQFPQGGIDPDLPLVGELKRELGEEIGTDRISVVQVTQTLYCYRFPPELVGSKGGKYAGQCHRWVKAILNVDDSGICFDREPAEFDGYRWVRSQEVLDLITPFKADVYRDAMTELGLVQATD